MTLRPLAENTERVVTAMESCFSQALKDLEAYLRLAPNADDAAEIREQAISSKKLQSEIH
jgi:regulator of sirC expression with transglutaminase-like and TPR domain